MTYILFVAPKGTTYSFYIQENLVTRLNVLIFDWDGTLVDSIKRIVEAMMKYGQLLVWLCRKPMTCCIPMRTMQN